MDVDQLLQPISPDMPCGEDLEYDAAFGAFERACQGKPEQQFGDTIVPSEPPDWREVRRLGMELVERTKDLRVAVQLAQAMLAVDGPAALRDVLKLLSGYLTQFWEQVHPVLDPEDDNDPTMRMNTLAALNDRSGILKAVRESPLVSSRVLGAYGLHDIAVARGEAEPAPGKDPVQQSNIDAAVMDCDVEGLQVTAAALSECLETVKRIENDLMERVGASHVVNLEDLTANLQTGCKIVTGWLEMRGASVSADSDPSGDSSADPTASGDSSTEPTTPATASVAAAAPNMLSGEITSRQDVIRVLDKVCDYYERYEPSSPLPLLIRRAKRLASKSFLEILQDLSPEALAQAQALGGVDQSEPVANTADDTPASFTIE